MQEKPPRTKALAYALVAAGACWVLSEGLELGLGDRTALSLGLTSMFHLLMVPGIWGAYAGQAGERSTLSRVAAGLASLGFGILVYPPLAVMQDPTLSIDAFMNGNPPFIVAGMLATVAVMLFGGAVLRTGSYAKWIGVVLVVCPPLFAATMLLDGPSAVAIAANLVEAVTLIVMGMRALETASQEQRRSR